MSKLIKRLRKIGKNLENCVIVGDTWGENDAIIENFRNVFVKKTGEPHTRARNVILRDKFQEMSLYPLISHVFIDYENVDHLQSVEKVLTHFSPMIYIGHDKFLDKEISNYLNSLQYEIIELNKTYQVWKRKI